MLLAEAISLDAGEVAAILIAFAVFCAVVIAVVVLGFIWAGKGGRGSERAFVGFLIVVALEGLFVLPALFAVAANRTSPLVLVGPAILAAQVAVYLKARAATRGGPPPSD